MRLYIKAEIDTSKMTRFADALEHEARNGGRGSGPLGQSLDVAAAVYMGFIQERFSRYSRGGGDWPPLAESTKRRRRKGSRVQGAARAARSAEVGRQLGQTTQDGILFDTGQLFASLGDQGYQVADIPAGVFVGTPIKHALYHQEGAGRLPQREIFVDPDPTTRDAIQDILEAGYQAAVNQLGG